MKKLLFLILLAGVSSSVFAQNKSEAEKLVDEGVAYHDKGDYEGAINRYDRALQLDKDNAKALTEKALTLVYSQKYDEAIKNCKLVIEKHPADKYLNSVYVTYGNALDGLKKTDKSIAIYNEGIQKFPEYFQLYFNKAVALSSVKRYEEAILCLEKSVTLNPKHKGSHDALARILYVGDKNVPSIMAFCRYLVLDPQSQKAEDDLELLQNLMNNNVKQTGENNITINVKSSLVDEKSKPKENDFRMCEVLLALATAADFTKENKGKPEVEKFKEKFESLVSLLKENRKGSSGFYWKYYAPYYMEMSDKKLTETFAYIAFASSNDNKIFKWLKANKADVDRFYLWSNSYTWKM